MSEQVHWHEGQFLQPHHLQAMQRQLTDALLTERRIGWPYPYGVIEMRLSPDALENHSVRVSDLRAVMPSGLSINLPADADLPPLNIKRAFDAGTAPFVVSLGVPLWQSDRGNSIDLGSQDDWRTKRIYRIVETARPDENTGENAQRVRFRRTNARLLLDDDDQTNMEVLPLIRIAHAGGQDVGLPKLDPMFIPPCLLLSGSVVLRDLVRDLANQIDASRKDLAQQMVRSGFTSENVRGLQLEQVLRLRTLARYSATLPHIAAAPATSPFDAYLMLREVLAELVALHPEQNDFDIADYDHDNPAVPFQELAEKIRRHVRPISRQPVEKVAFVPAEGGVLAASLTDAQLNVPLEYFLGIKTHEDPRAVATLAQDPDRFKVMARTMIKQAVGGVRLQEERNPPVQLPAQAGLYYFRLLRTDSARMWEQAKRDKSLAARWSGMEQSDYQLTLYMILPEVGADPAGSAGRNP